MPEGQCARTENPNAQNPLSFCLWCPLLGFLNINILRATPTAFCLWCPLVGFHSDLSGQGHWFGLVEPRVSEGLSGRWTVLIVDDEEGQDKLFRDVKGGIAGVCDFA